MEIKLPVAQERIYSRKKALRRTARRVNMKLRNEVS
jgi:hypothetical protein